MYVDNDPIVAAHGRALVEENLDWSRLIGLIQCNTLHHLPDDAEPRGVMKASVDALASGFYVAICHLVAPQEGTEHAQLVQDQDRFSHLMDTCFFRAREDIAAFFGGLELVATGLAELFNRWPDGPALRPSATG